MHRRQYPPVSGEIRKYAGVAGSADPRYCTSYWIMRALPSASRARQVHEYCLPSPCRLILFAFIRRCVIDIFRRQVSAVLLSSADFPHFASYRATTRVNVHDAVDLRRERKRNTWYDLRLREKQRRVTDEDVIFLLILSQSLRKGTYRVAQISLTFREFPFSLLRSRTS